MSSRCLLCLLVLAVASVVATPHVARADALRLPRVRPASALVGPMGLDVVDLRVDEQGAARSPEHLGFTRAGLDRWVPWTLDEPVARWLRDVAVRGAAGGGVRLVPLPGGPARLVVREFFCDGAPGLEPRCFVDVTLEWDQGDGPVVLYQAIDSRPWGAGMRLDPGVPEVLGAAIAQGVRDAFADQIEPEEPDVAPPEPEEPAAASQVPAGRGLYLVQRNTDPWTPVTPDQVDNPPRLYLVHSEEPMTRLSIDETVRRLGDPDLARWQARLLADTRREHRTAVALSFTGLGLVTTGALFALLANPPVGYGNGALGAIGLLSGISGGIMLSIAIPRAVSRDKHLTRLTEGDRMDHLEDMRFLRHVLERKRAQDRKRAPPEGAPAEAEGSD